MNHIIYNKALIIDALKQINAIKEEPLVLFVVDDEEHLLGTLTDGDIRRAIISGVSVNETVNEIMYKAFRSIQVNDNDCVRKLQELKKQKMKLVPVIDKNRVIVDIFNLEKIRTSLPLDVVMMAGGRGERLRPLTENTPKPLLKIGNKAIIDYNVERLILYGVKHINVTVNYLGEQIEEHFASPIDGIKVCTIREPKFLGTMGSIQYVSQFYYDTVLMMNSDLFTNIDYEDFYLHFKDNDADMSIAAVPYTVSVPYGIFELEGRDVKGVLEKPTYNYYANAGIYLIKKKLLELIPKDTFFNATDFMNLLMEKGYRVIRFPLNGTWIDIGNPQEYQKAKELVRHIK